MQRYKQLLFFAGKLQPMPEEEQIPENKVEGCVSQVWVKPYLAEDAEAAGGYRVYYRADSDSQLTKGLAALLVEGLSGATPAEVLALEPDFIEMLGLKQSLTPSRNNGFLNMLKLMQKKTLELVTRLAQGENVVEPSSPETVEEPVATADNGSSRPSSSSTEAGEETGVSLTPVYDAIVAKLTEALSPVQLMVQDNSESHAGHEGTQGLRSSETHFQVRVVSREFEGKSRVKRHRLVYDVSIVL
eukprot:scaffold2572_cov391-Prasinococcus_capsulatus_cf.AAC.10